MQLACKFITQELNPELFWIQASPAPSVAEQAHRIDFSRVLANSVCRNHERLVLDQHAHDIRVLECVLKPSQGEVVARQLLRQAFDIGFHRQHLAAQLGDVAGDFHGGAFAQVVDIGLERQAQAGHLDVGHGAARLLRQGVDDRRLDLLQHPLRFVIVDLACRADDASLVRVGIDDEPGVNGNAVPAHAGARLQDAHARMAVSQADEFPDVDIELVADDRQLVGKRYVDVAEAVLGQLAHLGGAGIGDDALAFDKGLVEGHGQLAGLLRHAADDTVVGHQFMHHLAGQHALGAVSDLDIGFLAGLLREAQVRAGLGQPARHLLGRADR